MPVALGATAARLATNAYVYLPARTGKTFVDLVNLLGGLGQINLLFHEPPHMLHYIENIFTR